MTRFPKIQVSVVAAALLAAAGEVRAAPADARGAWVVDDAVLRVRVAIETRPSHPSGGCIVLIPDGGILPRPGPATVVIGSSGQPLKHGCLWNDTDQALALVFDAPAGAGTVDVYFRRAPQVTAWTPETGLTPGVLIFAKPGAGSVEQARQTLSKLPLGKGVFFEQWTEPDLGGDPTGKNGPFSALILTYLAPRDPGRTWVSPVGPAEVSIDGHALTPVKKFANSGGEGQYLELSKDLHRLEIYHHNDGTANGRLRMAWRTPNDGVEELGGKSPEDSTKPMWSARPIRPDECVHSGKATVQEMESRDGTPVAAFSIQPKEYFWFADQPVILYELAAITRGLPADTRYVWSPGPGTELADEKKLTWLYEGSRDLRASLAASAAGKTSRCTYTVYAVCPGRNRSDINSRADGEKYRGAFLNMLRAAPANADPTAGWSDGIWDLFFRLAEPGRGQELLSHVFTKRWDAMRGRLTDERRFRLEDLFFSLACTVSPGEAAKWLDTFEREDKSGDRAGAWKLRRVEMLMYYTNRLDDAEKEARTLTSLPGPVGARARVRLGDIALLRGDADAATRLYGEVQTRVRHTQAASGDTGPALSSGLARSSAELRKQREESRTLQADKPTAREADWRIGAVRDTSVSETVRSQIEQGFFAEARRALDEWELEFPLSKISGNFVVVEAMLYTAMQDYVRPGRMLDAYCRGVDLTNYLADAMRLRMKCMLALKEPAARQEEFAVEMKRRFKYHPIAIEADNLLKAAKAADGGRRGSGKDTR